MPSLYDSLYDSFIRCSMPVYPGAIQPERAAPLVSSSPFPIGSRRVYSVWVPKNG